MGELTPVDPWSNPSAPADRHRRPMPACALAIAETAVNRRAVTAVSSTASRFARPARPGWRTFPPSAASRGTLGEVAGTRGGPTRRLSFACWIATDLPASHRGGGGGLRGVLPGPSARPAIFTSCSHDAKPRPHSRARAADCALERQKVGLPASVSVRRWRGSPSPRRKAFGGVDRTVDLFAASSVSDRAFSCSSRSASIIQPAAVRAHCASVC